MADSKVSALTSATPVAADELYLVDGGVSKKTTVALLTGVTQTARKNALDADTGIVGDGVADDSGAIETLLTTGGAFWFPEGTYLINRFPGTGVAAVNIDVADSLDVECHPKALFTAGTTCESTMFDIATNTAGLEVSLRWAGGVYDCSAQKNTVDASLPFSDDYAAAGTSGQSTTETVANIFNLPTTGDWSSVLFENGRSYSVANGSIKKSTDIAQHWRTGGGDTHILIGVEDGNGPVRVVNWDFHGARDNAVYLTAGGTGPHGGSVIEGCNFYWCMQAVGIKRGLSQVKVSNCLSYYCALGFWVTPAGTSRQADGVVFQNCTVQGAWQAFKFEQADRCSILNCDVLDSGAIDSDSNDFHTDHDNAVDLTGGVFAADGRAVYINGARKTRIDGLRVDGMDAAYVSASVYFTAFKITAIDLLVSASGADELADDTMILNCYLDGIEVIGGEVTTASVDDPNRTMVNGLTLGNGMQDYTGFTVLGASTAIDYGGSWTKVLTADWDEATNDITRRAVTGLAFPYHADVWYEVEAVIAQYNQTDDVTDFTGGWTYSGTAVGRVSWHGKAEGAGTPTAVHTSRSGAWDSSVTINAMGAKSTNALTNVWPVMYHGMFKSPTAGTLQYTAGKVSASATTLTIQAGSFLRVKRVG